MRLALRVVERELTVALLTWRSYVWFLFIQPVLFFGSLGLGVGELVDSGSSELGIPYREFAAPGLLMATVVFAAVGGSLWPVTLGTTWQRQYHATVATPVSPAALYTGYVLWISLRACVAGAAFLAVATVFGGVPSAWGVLAVPAAGLAAAALAAPVTAYSATQDSDSTYSVIMRLGVLPLFLFSGTTFPISQLPDALEALALASPLYHAVELARAATTADPSLDLFGHAAVLVALIAAGAAIGRRTMTTALAS